MHTPRRVRRRFSSLSLRRDARRRFTRKTRTGNPFSAIKTSTLQKTVNTNEMIVYVHIPKTAGTTFSREILQAEYGQTRYNIFPFHTDERVNRDQIEGLKASIPKLNLISGHFGYNIYLHNKKTSIIDSLNINKNISHITVLRNPIDRVISEFYFFKKLCKTFPKTIEQYLDRKAIVAHCLFGGNTNMPFSMLFTPNMQTLFITGGKYDVELAKHNLKNNFKAVGITEHLYESFLMMKRMFGWKIKNYESVNVNKKKPKRSELSINTINKIREKNSLDIELYNYALKLFKQKLKELGIPLRTKLIKPETN